MDEQRREYYRVQYPLADRPVLSAKTGRFEVIDVSEYGVRFKLDAEHHFEPGMSLIARIRFADGHEYECCGEVLRCDADMVSAKLLKPIPMQRILSESAYLLLTYNDRYANW
jgi:hypothetical protein